MRPQERCEKFKDKKEKASNKLKVLSIGNFLLPFLWFVDDESKILDFLKGTLPFFDLPFQDRSYLLISLILLLTLIYYGISYVYNANKFKEEDCEDNL